MSGEMDDGKNEPPRKKRRIGVFAHWAGLSWTSRLLALPVYVYRAALSPLLPRTCRFEPSCSTYALEALARHGPVRGSLLTLKRVSRCHPIRWLGAGEGYDPVPPAPERPQRTAARTEERDAE